MKNKLVCENLLQTAYFSFKKIDLNKIQIGIQKDFIVYKEKNRTIWMDFSSQEIDPQQFNFQRSTGTNERWQLYGLRNRDAEH